MAGYVLRQQLLVTAARIDRDEWVRARGLIREELSFARYTASFISALLEDGRQRAALLTGDDLEIAKEAILVMSTALGCALGQAERIAAMAEQADQAVERANLAVTALESAPAAEVYA